MLTSVGRVAARRVLFTRAPSQLVRQPAAAAVSHASRPVAAVRAFSVSRSVRMPETAQKTKSKTTAAGSKAKSTTKTAKKPKKKAAKKPAKPKVAKKKTQTPEEIALAERRMLRKISLTNRPTNKPSSAYQVYISQQISKGGQPLGDQVKVITANYHSLSDSEMQRLQATADTNSQANKASQEQWIRSFPVEVVYVANLARRRLNRKHEASMRKLHDDRQPKRGANGYSQFVKEHAAGAASNSGESFRTIAAEWQKLPESEKRAYKDSASRQSSSDPVDRQQMKRKAKAWWESQGVTGVNF